MLLSELQPTQRMSVIQTDWRVAVPSFVVAAVIVFAGLLFAWSYLWAFVIAAVVAAFVTHQAWSRLRYSWRIRAARLPPKSLPDAPVFDVEARTLLWRSLFADRPIITLVLFSYGTCVVSTRRSGDPVGDARELLDRFGHPLAGTPSADMLIYPLPTGDFVIGGGHPDIYTLVPRDAFPDGLETGTRTSTAALLGRAIRDLDAFALNVVRSVTAS